MNCMYCKQFVTQCSTTNNLWWACVRCRAYVEYKGRLADYTELAAIKIEHEHRGKNYYVWADYQSNKTIVGWWEETDDQFKIGHEVLVVPSVLRDLTPSNIKDKLSLLLTFS